MKRDTGWYEDRVTETALRQGREYPTLWVNLNHPCYTIDWTESESPEDDRILWGQGYVPLDALRQMGRELWANVGRKLTGKMRCPTCGDTLETTADMSRWKWDGKQWRHGCERGRG